MQRNWPSAVSTPRSIEGCTTDLPRKFPILEAVLEAAGKSITKGAVLSNTKRGAALGATLVGLSTVERLLLLWALPLVHGKN